MHTDEWHITQSLNEEQIFLGFEASVGTAQTCTLKLFGFEYGK